MSREQDARIAEWMGWRRTDEQRWPDFMMPPDSTVDVVDWVPEYSTDRNAMAQAEAVVGERGLDEKYSEILFDVAKCFLGYNEIQDEWFGTGLFDIATATAPQRAEALCRVIDGEQPTPPDVA